jgi:hypothetical protein
MVKRGHAHRPAADDHYFGLRKFRHAHLPEPAPVSRVTIGFRTIAFNSTRKRVLIGKSDHGTSS